MTFRITVKYEDKPPHTYIETGNRDELMDREYDRGALVLSIVVVA